MQHGEWVWGKRGPWEQEELEDIYNTMFQTRSDEIWPTVVDGSRNQSVNLWCTVRQEPIELEHGLDIGDVNK